MSAVGASAGLPGPLHRLLRDRLLVGATVVIAAFVVAASAITQSVQVSITSSVDANWRGAYDILVRPKGSRLDLESTQGLVEPNFLGFSGTGGISLDQLASIRAIQDVEFAAPVSVVGYLSYTTWAPSWQTTAPPKEPTLYRIDLSLKSSDGLRPIVLQQQSERVLMEKPKDVSSLFTSIVGEGDCCTGDFNADGSLASVGGSFSNAPALVSPIIAVDPVAEANLLGSSASFLAPLANLSDPDNLTVSKFDATLVPADLPHAQDDLQTAREYAPSRPVVPLIVSDRVYAPLTMTLTLTQLGQPLKTMPPTADQDPAAVIAAAQAAAGAGETTLGTKSIDLSGQLVPFVPPPAALTLPGSGPPADQGILLTTPSLSQVSLANRPQYRAANAPASGSTPTYSIKLQGISDPSGNLLQPGASSPPGSILATGAEPAYRTFTDLPLATGVTTLQNAYDQPFFMLPVGRFDLSDLNTPKGTLSYVPLGAYDPPDTQLVAGPDGRPLASPTSMTPTLNPAGLVAVPPLAITDLAAAELLRGSAPIDAIRVRVAGLSRYDAIGRATVERVASAIASLGLDVDIVAGSSPQPVEVYVPGYVVSQSPPADLGYVSQSWTTLGAASRVEVGLSLASFLLVGLGLLMALALALALAVSRAAIRSREVAVLQAIGCSRRTRLSWMTGDVAVASSVVLLVSLLAWAATGEREIIGLAAGCLLAAALFAAAALGVVVADRVGGGASGDVWSGFVSRSWAALHGPISYGFRGFLGRPIRSAALVGSLSLSSAAAALSMVVVTTAIARAGPTRLALAITGLIQPAQSAVLVLIAVTGIFLMFLLLSREIRDREDEMIALAAAGWTRIERRRVLWVQRVVAFVPAAVLATVLATTLAVPVALASPEVVAGLTLVICASTLASAELTSERVHLRR